MAGPIVSLTVQGRVGAMMNAQAEKETAHDLCRGSPEEPSRTRHLPHGGAGVSSRPLEDRVLHSRQCGGDPPGGRPRGTAGHPRARGRQGGLLRPLPLRHGVQGGPPVLPGPQEERFLPGGPHGGTLRHLPDHGLHGGQGSGLRPGHRRGPPGRGLHRVHRHRHGRGRHQSPGHSRRTEGRRNEQHSRGLRGHLPRGNGLRGVVSVQPRAQAHQGEPQGGEPEDGRSGHRRRKHGGGAPIGLSPVAVPGLSGLGPGPLGEDRSRPRRPVPGGEGLHRTDPQGDRDPRSGDGNSGPGRGRGGAHGASRAHPLRSRAHRSRVGGP